MSAVQSELDKMISWNEEYRLWWPNDEDAACYRHMLLRVTDVDVGTKYVKTKGYAIQAGSFIGMWPARLGRFFERVWSFEPIAHLAECARLNTRHLPHVRISKAALGANVGDVPINPKRNGCTTVGREGTETTKTLNIDSLCLPRCDFIYLDVEGYELQALAGAAATIAEFHPVIMLETFKETYSDYCKYMERLGYEAQEKIHLDVVFKPR